MRLDRVGGEGQFGDELLSAVAERVRPHRADGHGQSWAVLAAHHARLKELLEADLTVVRAGELLAREGVVVPERALHCELHSPSRRSAWQPGDRLSPSMPHANG